MSKKPYGFINVFKHDRDHFHRSGIVHKSRSVAESYMLYDLANGYESVEAAESDWTWVGTFEIFLLPKR